MSASDVQLDEPGETFRFVLVTAGADLLNWSTLDALYEAGCGDATIGHDTLEFTRAAASRDQALCSALRDVESVAGVSVVRIEFGEGLAERA
ncbi:MAG: hypothetical protein OXM54_08685 [Acidimicrobiaceae bacterium]|nr:hypothetical protein [Acidimicrobiaceae bacterium]